MLLAPGDRVQATDRVAYFEGGVFPGRAGHVVQRTPDKVWVEWEDDRTKTLVDPAVLMEEGPTWCPLCRRKVYQGTGCCTGHPTEYVYDSTGLLALVAGIGIDHDMPAAIRQSKERRYLSADMAIQSMMVHWRVCRGVAKYPRARATIPGMTRDVSE